MRALHVIPSVSARHGGPSYAIQAYARALQQAGVEVTIATTDDDGPGSRLKVPLGRPISREGIRHIFFKRSLQSYKVSWELAHWFTRHARDFDLVHVHALFSFSSSMAGICARRSGVPYVIRPLGVLNHWGLEHRRRLSKRLSLSLIELPLLKNAAALHFTAIGEAREAMTLDGHILKKRQSIIPIPVALSGETNPTSFYARFPEARIRKIVLFLSRIDVKKGIELLLDAFAQAMLIDPSLLLVIAGAGDQSYIHRLKERAGRLDLEDSILWMGHVQGQEKAALMAAASVFVLPSYSENFGIAAVEALAAGVPVVISKEVAISGDIENADAGLIVTCDSAAIADAIVSVLKDPAGSQRRALNGRELVRERYSFKAIGGALLNVYREILAS